MRRLSVICALLALTLPGASAARSGAPGDGTLSVKNGIGKLSIQARGGVIGHFTDGVLTVKDPNPDDGISEVVTGAERTHVVNEFVTKYSGHDVSFRYIGGRFAITLVAGGINLSAIGKGSVQLVGDDGTFSLNSSTPQPITDVLQVFPLGASTTG